MSGIESNPILEAQWGDTVTAMAEKYPGVANSLMVMADVSASMMGTPMEVSVTMALLMTALGGSGGNFMTFDTTPRWVSVSPDMTLREKVRHIMASPWGGSTNVLGAMGLVLDVCKDNKFPEETVASLKLLIVSDMQFNAATTMYSASPWATTFEHIQCMFRNAGYSNPPIIVFWNVRATKGFPAPADVPGVIQLSGFSPHLLHVVMDGNLEELKKKTGDTATSLDAMYSALANPAYDRVREACASVQEGRMAGYVPPPPVENEK